MVCVNNEKLKTGDGINLITLLRSTSDNLRCASAKASVPIREQELVIK